MSININNITITINKDKIVKEFTLTIPPGEVHAIMGPNGTGKSTLAKALAGHKDYVITNGKVTLNGKDIVGLKADVISRAGLFLAFQYPESLPGITIYNFILAALQARIPKGNRINPTEYNNQLRRYMDMLQIEPSFTTRIVNEGLSGGEKKKCEILQMMMLNPSFVILDEPDSGLDIDAIKIVAYGINYMLSKKIGILIITHYQRILNYINTNVIHIMYKGKVVKSGSKDLALKVEEKGYECFKYN